MSESTVYISTPELAAKHPDLFGAILRCTECPDWECDVDGMLIGVAAREAAAHEREHSAGVSRPGSVPALPVQPALQPSGCTPAVLDGETVAEWPRPAEVT